MKTFVLPDLGEGLPDGEISEWHVKEGDSIQADSPLVSIETAKAIVEIPSPYTGKIVKLHGKKGDVIPTGSPLVDFSIQGREETGTVAGEIKVGHEVLTEQAMAISDRVQGVKVLPAVRALAKKLNVDLATITPSGADNTITADDVKGASQILLNAPALEPLRGVRRFMANVMSASHAEVVPVTVIDDVDITSWVKEKDFTTKVIMAIVKACAEEPALNAWYDSKAMGRRVFKEVHVGLAIDTEDGLFVPVIKDAQTKNKEQIRSEIETLKKEVRSRTIAPQKLQGSTIVLSNFGNFAGRYANPIVVPPTVAILGVGSLREAVLPYQGTPAIR
ncbi:MAG TPA: dihydrolipoamide acetyltransferase family protein, partial [Candidatus Berkiella sp.]|nr:dihydrolipoamide acetyltransferase family protein [Candidatus Berkiella sp.]